MGGGVVSREFSQAWRCGCGERGDGGDWLGSLAWLMCDFDGIAIGWVDLGFVRSLFFSGCP